MQVSSLIEKLQYFPQDAEVVSSDYGLHVYLYGYITTEPEHNLEVVPSYDLREVEVEKLPWITDPTWLDHHKVPTLGEYDEGKETIQEKPA